MIIAFILIVVMQLPRPTRNNGFVHSYLSCTTLHSNGDIVMASYIHTYIAMCAHTYQWFHTYITYTHNIMYTRTTIVSNTLFPILSHQNIISYHVQCEKGISPSPSDPRML